MHLLVWEISHLMLGPYVSALIHDVLIDYCNLVHVYLKYA